MRVSPVTSSPLFACKDITLDLGGRTILDRISLRVDPGEVLGIIGPNGAGKTSLLEVLSGRLRPKTGTVTFNGEDINSLPLQRRTRLGIGRTFQTPVVPEELTVAEVFKAARQAYKPYLTPDDAEWGSDLVAFHDVAAPPEGLVGEVGLLGLIDLPVRIQVPREQIGRAHV